MGTNKTKGNGRLGSPTLAFEVRYTASEGSKRDALRQVLAEGGVGIIYTATVKACHEVHTWLGEDGVRAGLYHNKMKASEREAVEASFVAGEYSVLVATKALKELVVKPSIDFVIHYQFPESLERYAQEAGLADTHDGRKPRALLLYRMEDKRIQSYLLVGRYSSRADVCRVFEALKEVRIRSGETEMLSTEILAVRSELSLKRARLVIALLEDAGIVERKQGVRLVRDFQLEDLEDVHLKSEEYRTRGNERLEAMMRYAQTGICRLRFLQEYFDEMVADDCGHCDNCSHSDRLSTGEHDDYLTSSHERRRNHSIKEDQLDKLSNVYPT